MAEYVHHYVTGVYCNYNFKSIELDFSSNWIWILSYYNAHQIIILNMFLFQSFDKIYWYLY